MLSGRFFSYLKKIKISRNGHSLSLVVPLVVTRCHSLYYSLSLVVIGCHALYYSLSLVAICCHSLYHLLSVIVTRCTIRLSFYKRSAAGCNFYFCLVNFAFDFRSVFASCKLDYTNSLSYTILLQRMIFSFDLLKEIISLQSFIIINLNYNKII